MNCTLTVGELYGCKLYLSEAVKSEKSKIRSEWFCIFKLKKKKLLNHSASNSLYFKISVFLLYYGEFLKYAKVDKIV